MHDGFQLLLLLLLLLLVVVVVVVARLAGAPSLPGLARRLGQEPGPGRGQNGRGGGHEKIQRSATS